MSRYPHDAKVYVGDLGSSASKQDLERSFSCNYKYERHTLYRLTKYHTIPSDYGEIRSVWVARNPPGFAFVEFEDER